MEFYQHFVISAIFGSLYWIVFDLNFFSGISVMTVTVIGGTLIDLDHFLLGRLKRGNWRKLREAFKNPVRTLYENEKVLGDEWLPPGLRVKVHGVEVVLSGIIYLFFQNHFSLVLWFAVSLHLLSDLTSDYIERRDYIDR